MPIYAWVWVRLCVWDVYWSCLEFIVVRFTLLLSCMESRASVAEVLSTQHTQVQLCSCRLGFGGVALQFRDYGGAEDTIVVGVEVRELGCERYLLWEYIDRTVLLLVWLIAYLPCVVNWM